MIGRDFVLEHQKVSAISAEDAAKAMREDHFYLDYGYSSLVLHGQVDRIDWQADHLVVDFKTGDKYHTRCEMSSAEWTPSPGDQITVVTPGGTARRDKDGVFLRGCLVVSAE